MISIHCHKYHNHCLAIFYFGLITTTALTSQASVTKSKPWPCSANNVGVQTCNSSLYHNQRQSLTASEIAHFYNVPQNQTKLFLDGSNQDYLVYVPCTCTEVDDGIAYFYNTSYLVQKNDTFGIVNCNVYSGQAILANDTRFYANETTPIHLLCGCLTSTGENSGERLVVTYTVQYSDTLGGIAALFSSSVDEILSLNNGLIKNPNEIVVGWVLFVPMGSAADQDDSTKSAEGEIIKKKKAKPVLVGLSLAVAALVVGTGCFLIILYRRRKSNKENEKQETKTVKSVESKITSGMGSRHRRETIDDFTGFESERPMIFGLEEIEEAIAGFEESRKIGEGGYGSVYLGLMGDQEVAVKKMKASKTKEFLAELKVLCRVHHINVVELIGYAAGEDYLYLVYEYVRNGSLNDHLHDPLLKGHQPLSWNARLQIAMDAARGIEYIHDHTKAQYVHRDIKTSNILLDDSLRAKVADFGLAKLVERSGEDDYIATRLVGTPGYLPPESVLELQTTAKSDVFAFGVVTEELITGKRALIRDNRETNKVKSLVALMYETFQKDDTGHALESIIDRNLNGNYPLEEVYKLANVAMWCLNEDSTERPEIRDIVVKLSQIWVASLEWEASLGGRSQVFSGVFSGR